MTRNDLESTLKYIFRAGISAGHPLGSGDADEEIAEVLTAWEMLTRERDAALLEIYVLQEAAGCSVRRLGEALEESYGRFPHIFTDGMRFVRDMCEAQDEPTEEA